MDALIKEAFLKNTIFPFLLDLKCYDSRAKIVWFRDKFCEIVTVTKLES